MQIILRDIKGVIKSGRRDYYFVLIRFSQLALWSDLPYFYVRCGALPLRATCEACARCEREARQAAAGAGEDAERPSAAKIP